MGKRLVPGLLLFAFAISAAAQNPLPLLCGNPSFETGAQAPWGLYNADVQRTGLVSNRVGAKSGDFCLRLARETDSEWGFAYQRLNGKVTWGDRVRIEAWVRQPGPKTNENVFVGINIKETNLVWITGHNVYISHAPIWDHLSAEFTIPGTNAFPDLNAVIIEADVGLQGKGFGIPILIDNVSVRKVPPRKPGP